MGWTELNRRKLRWLVPRTSAPSDAPLRAAIEMVPADGAIVDLGAGGRRINGRTFTVDGNATTRPDLVSDLHSVPLEDARFDCAVCTGTLEHVADPGAVGRELVRLLKPGGIAYIDVPFMQGFHADPDDFRRWTLHGLRRFCEGIGLDVVQSGVHIGPGSALSWVASEYVRILLGGLLGKAASVVVRWLLLPVLFIDEWVARRPEAFRIACGVYVVGRKRGGVLPATEV